MKAKVKKTNVPWGRDISIPGSEMFDTLETLGIEEEENFFYSSSGADDHDSQEEDTEEKIALNYHWYVMTLERHSRKAI